MSDHSEIMKAKWANPEFKEAQKKKISDGLRKAYSKPKNKRRLSKGIKRYWKSLTKEEKKAKMAAATKASKSPEAIKKMSESMKAMWAKIPKSERRKKVRAFIDAGQAARGSKDRSGLELYVQKALNFFNLNYEISHLVEGYRVDFYLPEQKTVIEVDGYWHTREDRKAADKERDETLTSAGHKVVRITEEQIKKNAYVAVADALDIKL